MIHSPEYLESKYETRDPWGYRIHPDDIERKRRILAVIEELVTTHTFQRALDIGAGEGWITAELPAEEIEAIEISDNAASRFPDHVRRVNAPTGHYSLILATGILYAHYNVDLFHHWIRRHASGLVVTCNLADSEVPLDAETIYEERFPYRDRVQHLAVYTP